MSRFPVSGHALRRVTWACLWACCAFAARAEDAAPTATVVVTGNPLGRDEALQPSSVLAGDGLALRRAGTLGETLSGLPGVATTGFGPQAARPVIRGLDGDRIRLLDNGGASADASNLSFDHAVAIDPLVIERIEVLRGPAALLYGGNATGGVVNTLDNRVPREAIDGFTGRSELRLGGAAAERAGAAVLEGGAKGFSWHADVAARRSEDLRVPRFVPVADGEVRPATGRIANSAGDSRAGALGLSWADADGFIGASVDGYRNDYGVTVEPDVTIRMRRQQLQLAGERRKLAAGPFSQIEFRLGHTRYRHEEVEGTGAVGTVFDSQGDDLRVQGRLKAVATPLGELHGVLGLQAEQLDFSALGEEAFVPTTHSRSAGVFALEELRFAGGASLSAGARFERSRVGSEGDAADSAAPRFGGASTRRFTPRNLSLSGSWPLAAGWGLSASLGHTERAPAYYELFANGVHVATGAFERGDPDLGVERSRQAELGLQWKQGPHQLRAQVFATRFANYIALDATGVQRPETGDNGETTGVPEYRFRAVPARLHGLELEGRTRFVERPWTLDLSANLDWLRGRNADSGEPLPRLAPMRATLALDATHGAWRGGAQLRHAAAQNRVSGGDVPTPGYTLLNLWAGWATRWGGTDALWTLKLDNATDRLAYNATAVRTARELAPLGGRALTAAVRLSW